MIAGAGVKLAPVVGQGLAQHSTAQEITAHLSCVPDTGVGRLQKTTPAAAAETWLPQWIHMSQQHVSYYMSHTLSLC